MSPSVGALTVPAPSLWHSQRCRNAPSTEALDMLWIRRCGTASAAATRHPPRGLICCGSVAVDPDPPSERYPRSGGAKAPSCSVLDRGMAFDRRKLTKKRWRKERCRRSRPPRTLDRHPRLPCHHYSGRAHIWLPYLRIRVGRGATTGGKGRTTGRRGCAMLDERWRGGLLALDERQREGGGGLLALDER